MNISKHYGIPSLAFNSVQNAVQAVVEAAGSRSETILAILPICTPTYVLAGVLRGGAHPMLLDCNEEGFNYNIALIKDIVSGLEAPTLVFFNRTLVRDLEEELEALLAPHITVGINWFTPAPSVTHYGKINIYNTWAIVPGAVLTTEYEEVVPVLDEIRTGVLGMSSNMSLYHQNKLKEVNELCSSGEYAIKPLYEYPEVRARWPELPEYTNALKFWGDTLADAT